ncbi:MULTISPECIES: glutathionylspermidine synthase family protein [unclassified Bacillus cereus group]|uniref:glutathionylspermidine synthase family protein n=1 Tax=unclassified Bacillus cereus group TaxID=2750818 RepID=UPI001F568AF4|nr:MULTISPECIES: glutathionylspermidine synthase family protein [unclassified Bacillus cereus group]
MGNVKFIGNSLKYPLSIPSDFEGGDIKKFYNIHAGYKKIRPFNKPILLGGDSYNEINYLTCELLNLLFEVPKRLFNNNYQEMMRILRYKREDMEFLNSYLANEELLHLSKYFSRNDYIITKGKLRLVEFNVGATIGGIGIIERFYELIVKDSLEEIQEQPNSFVHTLENLTEQYLSKRDTKPFIVFICWEDEVGEVHPHEAKYFLMKAGYDCEVVSVEEIVFRNEEVYFGKRKIDIAYGCFTYNEIDSLEKKEVIDKLVQCHLSKKLLYLVPPSATIFGNKGMLALMKSKEFLDLCSEDERLILSHIPETKLLNSETLDWAIRNRESLVLKPAIGNGGMKVFFGLQIEKEDWNELLGNLLHSNSGLFILQRYVETDTYNLDGTDYQICLGGLSYGTGFSGIFTRIMPDTKRLTPINCTQGGFFSVAIPYEFKI